MNADRRKEIKVIAIAVAVIAALWFVRHQYVAQTVPSDIPKAASTHRDGAMDFCLESVKIRPSGEPYEPDANSPLQHISILPAADGGSVLIDGQIELEVNDGHFNYLGIDFAFTPESLTGRGSVPSGYEGTSAVYTYRRLHSQVLY